MGLRATAICLLGTLALAGCGSGGSKSSSGGGGDAGANLGDVAAPRATKAPWPAPGNPMALPCAAGLVPEKAEFLQYHVHAHLDVFVNGRPVIVPAGIGIDVENPGVKVQTGPTGVVTGAGGIEGCNQPCISPLHTHDLYGALHTETTTPSPNHLGQ